MMRAFVMALAMMIALLAISPVRAGSIRATLKPHEPIVKAQALRRAFTDTGMETKTFDGAITGDQLAFTDLPAGDYDLLLTTETGLVWGWNARVPASDYVEEQPLTDAQRHAVFDKLAKYYERHYPDQCVVLDMQGNIQNAALIVAQLRTRPSVGGGFAENEWVWRVDRWQYEDPEEHTWAPSTDQPFYAIERRRLFEEDYRKLRIVFARHLGGITISDDRADINLGIIVVPKTLPGVHAVEPDGASTTPVTIKPKPEHWPALDKATDKDDADAQQ